MALSYDLLSQFAKLVNPQPKTSTETTVYGTVHVDADGNKYVHLDGSPSELLTPISDSSVDVAQNERVSATIKDHTLTVTGNISSPAGRNSDVQSNTQAVTKVEKQTIVLASEIQATTGTVETLRVSNEAEINNLKAATATIQGLVAAKAEITDLEAATGRIDRLESTNITTEILEAEYAKIKDLDVVKGNITELESKKASIEDLTATNAEITNLKTKNAEIENLVAEKADVKDLHAQNAEIANLKAKDAEIEGLYAKRAEVDDLYAKKAEIKNLDAKYANIDFTNIGDAAIDTFYAKSGIINKVTISEGVVVKELVGVTIKGDLIEGGTVKADKLVVKGSDGIYYKLNYEAGKIPTGEPVPDDSLHGSVITAKSITAEKVSVNDLVAFGATIGGFHITDNSLYSGAKGAVDADAIRGIYLDAEGQLAIGDKNNFLKYYKDPTDGKYKLEIAADQFRLSSGKTLEESVTDNLEIGARNLIRNSRTMIFEDYCFAGDSAVLGTAVIGAMILGKEG